MRQPDHGVPGVPQAGHPLHAGPAQLVAQVRALSTDYPNSAWTLEALNSLASYYIVQDDDASADGVFRELFARFPDSKYGERAAWKIGWWAYKNGKYADAAQAFDAGAATFPRADTRPAWLYWSGRAYDQIGEAAEQRCRRGESKRSVTA